MRNNKKKGFTLVELLVVIAILAILSTVAVVGYTSYIKSTTVAVDENLASQLTRFLEAYKVNNPDEITEDNIREVTEKLLNEGGIDELVPQSLDYGYHFYYDLETGEYVVMEDKDVTDSLATRLFSGIFAEATQLEGKYEKTPGNSFTKDNRYFLVEGNATELGKVIEKFYNVTDAASYEDLYKAVTDLDNSLVTNYFKNTVIIADGENFATDASSENVAFADNVVVIANTTNIYNGSAWSTPIQNSDETPIITTTTSTFFTIPASVKYISGGSLYVDGTATIIVNNTAAKVGDLAFELFSNATIKTNDGTYVCATGLEAGSYKGDEVIIHTNGKVETEVLLNFYNPAKEYTVEVTETGELKISNHDTFAYVALDAEKFMLIGENFVGGLYPELPSSTLSSDLVWTLADGTKENAYVKIEGNVVTFKAATSDTLSFKAHLPNNGDVVAEDVNYGVKTVYKYNVGINFNNKAVNASSTHTFVFGGSYSGSVPVTFTTGNYSFSDPITNGEIKLDESVNITLDYTVDKNADGTDNTDTVSFLNLDTTSGYVLKISSDAEGTVKETISIRIGSGKFPIATLNNKEVTLFDTENLHFEKVNTNIMYVGNGNEVKISDLFEAVDGTIPAGAQVMISKAGSNTDYTNVTDLQAFWTGAAAVGETAATFGAASTTVPIESIDDTIRFYGTAQSDPNAYVCIVVDGVRVSDDFIIKVREGNNVRSWDDLVTNAGKSVVVLKDKIEIAEGGSYTIADGTTFFGNASIFDLTDASNANGTGGVISLYGRIQDTKVIGAVYSSFQFSGSDEQGSAVIAALGQNAEIENCYIANCRSALRIDTATLKIKDSVLYGGLLGNILICGDGNLIIDGTVATVQTGYGDVWGTGIIGWFDDAAKNIQILAGAELKQYNFMSSTEAAELPKVLTVEMSKPFTTILNNNDYSDNWFYDSSNNKYVNAGVAVIDKTYGMEFTYTPTINAVGTGVYEYCYACKKTHTSEDQPTSSCCSDWKHPYEMGHNVPTEITDDYVTSFTLKLSRWKTPAGMTYRITYDPAKYTCTTATGVVDTATGWAVIDAEWTGTSKELTYAFTAVDGVNTKEDAYRSYVSAAETSKVLSVNRVVAGEDDTTSTVEGVAGYSNPTYTYPMSDLDWFAAEKLAGEFGYDIHNYGIHSQNIVFDVWTPLNTDKTLFTEWQSMVSKGASHKYHPEATNTFTNGYIFPQS